MTIRVVVVDDSALVRSILCDLINRAGDMRVVGTAADPFAAREVIRELDPDVITTRGTLTAITEQALARSGV